MSATNRFTPGTKSRRIARQATQDAVYDCFSTTAWLDVQDVAVRLGRTPQAVVHAMKNLEKQGKVYRESVGVYRTTHPQPGE